jgi:hypothetical protein
MHLSIPLTLLVTTFTSVHTRFAPTLPRDLTLAQPAPDLSQHQVFPGFEAQLITIAAAIAGGLGYPLVTALLLGFEGLRMANAQNEDLVAHAPASQELVERQAGFPWIMHSSSSALTPSAQLAGMAALISGGFISPLVTALILGFSGLAIVSAHNENEATHQLASQELAERQAPGTFWFSAAPSIAPSLKHAGIAAVVAGALASPFITALALIFSGMGMVTASPLPEANEEKQDINIDLPVRNGVKSVFGFGDRPAVDGASTASPNFSLHIQLAALVAIVAGGLVSPYISALAVGFWVLGMARAQEVGVDTNPVSISQSLDGAATGAARVTGRLISPLITVIVPGFQGLGGVNA